MPLESQKHLETGQLIQTLIYYSIVRPAWEIDIGCRPPAARGTFFSLHSMPVVDLFINVYVYVEGHQFASIPSICRGVGLYCGRRPIQEVCARH